MTTHQLLELLGYIASALVALSLMMRSVLRLRWINLIGSAAFAIYGFAIRAYPVAAVNAFIALVNVYYLRQMLATKEYFVLLRIRPDAEYLRYFLEFHREEIARFLPDFTYRAAPDTLVVFVLRDMVPAGLLIGDVRDGVLQVQLDFVIPQFRDFRIARCLFVERADFFRHLGIASVVSPPGTRAHVEYLERMGFVARDGAYRLTIAHGG